MLGSKYAKIPIVQQYNMWPKDNDFEDSSCYWTIIEKFILQLLVISFAFGVVTVTKFIICSWVVNQFMQKSKSVQYIRESPGKEFL